MIPDHWPILRRAGNPASTRRSRITLLIKTTAITALMPFLFIGQLWAAFVDPATCGGDGQPACYLSSAKNHGKVLSPNPGNGAFKDIGRGEWWRCPAGHNRSAAAVNAWDACVKDISKPESSAFWDVGKNEWWKCPAGFNRTWAAVDAGDACSRTNSKPGSTNGSLVFHDVGKDEYWSCPSGYGRTIKSVTASDACDKWVVKWPPWDSYTAKSKATFLLKKVEKRRATYISSGTSKQRATYISKVRTPKPGGAFEDIGRGEWWSCPAGFTRNANPVTHESACSATVGKACDAGNIDVGNPIKGYTCYKKDECGANGQRPCLIAERIPSCNSGMAEDFVDGICVDSELAKCLTLTRAMLVTRDVVGAMNRPSPQLQLLQKASDALLDSIGDAINEIINALPSEIRNDLAFDIGTHINDAMADLGESVGQAVDSVIASLGLEADTFNKFATAVSTRTDEIADFVSNPQICYMSDAERGERLETALGFKPGVDGVKAQQGNIHFMLGLSASLEGVFKGVAAGVDLDVYVAYGMKNGEARVFWALGPAVGLSTGSAGADVSLAFGFKSAQTWGAFEGWAGSAGVSVDIPVKMRGFNGFTVAGTFLDPFANESLVFDGGVFTSSLTKGGKKVGVAAGANLQHTWRIKPKIVPKTFTGTLQAEHSNKCLDASLNNNNLHQWDCHGGDNQKVVFKSVSGKAGVYTMALKHNNKCLDVTGASKASGANIQQWDCVDVPQQQFKLEKLGSSTYKITSIHSNMALGVPNYSQANAGNVEQWLFASQTNQKWKLVRDF